MKTNCKMEKLQIICNYYLTISTLDRHNVLYTHPCCDKFVAYYYLMQFPKINAKFICMLYCDICNMCRFFDMVTLGWCKKNSKQCARSFILFPLKCVQIIAYPADIFSPSQIVHVSTFAVFLLKMSSNCCFSAGVKWVLFI